MVLPWYTRDIHGTRERIDSQCYFTGKRVCAEAALATRTHLHARLVATKSDSEWILHKLDGI